MLLNKPHPELMPFLSVCSYCMKVFLKIVPDDWICEICDPGKDTTSLKYVEDNKHRCVHTALPFTSLNNRMQQILGRVLD